VTVNFNLPDGHSLLSGATVERETEDLGNGVTRVKRTHDFTFSPNPDWELFRWDYTVPAGEHVVIEKVQIATECVVPEPSSIALVLLMFGIVPGARPARRMNIDARSMTRHR
jgi:hypothetical protein